MHKRLREQLEIAAQAGAGSAERLDRLVTLVDAQYQAMDELLSEAGPSAEGKPQDEVDRPGSSPRQSSFPFVLLEAAIDAVGDAVLTIAEDGRVVGANPASESLFGQAVLGVNVADLFMLSTRESPAAFLRRIEAEGEHCRSTAVQAGSDPIDVEVTLAGRSADLCVLVVRDCSGRYRVAQALADSERRYRELFENVVDGVYETTVDGRFISVNPALVTMLGYESAAELKNIVSTEQLYMDPRERRKFIADTNRRGELRNAELRLRRKDGKELAVLENARAVRDAAGCIVGYQGTLSDITEMRRAERAVHSARERALVTLGAIADAVITTDAAGFVAYMNPVAEALTGVPLEEAKGKPVETVAHLVDEADGSPLGDPRLRHGESRRVRAGDQHTVLVSQNGKRIPVQESVAPLFDCNGGPDGVVMVLHDVSSERRLRNQLAYQASHDALTGLINRREFDRRVEKAMDRSAEGQIHSLLYLDLDQFKTVNDSCGHGAGDELLRQITELIRSRVRARDIVSRLGGDEFGVLLPYCGQGRAVEIADTLREGIRNHRFAWGSKVFDLGVSIGIVEVGASQEGIEAMLAAADMACYAAKNAGRNRIHVHSPEKAGSERDGLASLRQLTQAMDEGQLQLFFQPIVPIGSYQPDGGHFELLLRLRGQSGELISPGAFLPAAERYNLMPKLDRWVVEKALSELAACDGPGGRASYTVSVNVSGSSLEDTGFLEFLMAALESRQLPAAAICFEIAEAAAVSHLDRTRRFIADVRDFGCEVALDDFGRGLSSFSYLRELPVDYVKIDGHFIRNICSDAVDHTMVDAIRSVGGALGIRTVAEHVDSAESLSALTEIGIHFAQGFHIAAPAPVGTFPRLRRRGGPPRLQLA